MNVRSWLREHGLEEYADTFAENGVDTNLLAELSNEDLKDLGVARLADRKRLLKEIERLSDANVQDEPEIAHPGSSEGERRQVTVLFADLAGFTELSTKLDPEDMHELLTRYYEIVDGIVEQYGGTVDKHLGDGVMALFGAPIAHGDDPVRAARAAFDIHEGMKALSSEAKRNLSVHVGIASGEVIAGGLGRDGHKEYTVIGDSVNLASRLDGLANSGETMIDEVVQRAVMDHVEVEPVGDVEIKGLDAPVKVWRARNLLSPSAEIERSTFVGRRRELRQFDGVLASCNEDKAGQAVLIRGEAGIGKTRLVEEFTVASERMGFAVHKGLVLDFGVGEGQDAIRVLVRSLLNVVAGSEAQRSAACDAAMAEGWADGNQQVFLRDLLDLPQLTGLHEMYDAMDNTSRNQGKQQVVADLVIAVTNIQPVVLVVEDVHWADRLALGHLAVITATVCNAAAILVVTTRIEGDPLDSAWRGGTHGSPMMTIDLGPLRQNEALELASDFMDETRRAALRCVERADGNPLFLEQLLRNAGEATDESVPASLQSLVLARVDRLLAVDKEALQAASVIGKRFALDTLRHLIGNADYECANLTDQQLIRPEGDDYLFSHALIQEGVYSSLLKKRRQILHGRAADLFAEKDLMLKAEHLDRAEDPAAPSAYLEAAEVQAEIYHFEKAMRLIERGLNLAIEDSDKFELICMKGQMLHDLGSIDQSIRAYGEMLDIAEDDRGRCRAWLGLAAGMRIADRYDEALAILDEAEVVAGDNGMVRESAKIHHIRGNLYFPMGRFEECAEEHEKSLRYAKEAGSAEAEANAVGGLADASYVAGRMATAFQHFSRCAELANQNGFSGIEIINSSMAGFSRMYLNQLGDALKIALKTVTDANQIGNQRAEMMGEILAVKVLFEQADYANARQHNAHVIEFSRRLGAPRFEAQALLYEGKLDRVEGRRGDAIKTLESALEMSGNVGHGFTGPRILSALARCLDESKTKCDALDEGEQMLKDGSVSHNHFFFYPDAIQVSLEMENWDGAERYSSAFEDFTKAEPLPWSDFFIARGRALAAWGRNRRDTELTAEIQRLCHEAEAANIATALPSLEDALIAK